MARSIPVLALVAAGGLCAVPARAEGAGAWSGSVTLYGYDTGVSDDYWSPVVTADRGRLHLEARYQYEGLETTSLWAGINFHAGRNWVFDATAMLGGVFGDLDGIAPGYRLSLARGWFELASEGECYFATGDRQDNFVYSWTEVAGYPTDWLRVGLAAQRTRAYESELDVQRGVFAAFTYERLDVAAYAFNPGWEEPTYVLALRIDF